MFTEGGVSYCRARASPALKGAGRTSTALRTAISSSCARVRASACESSAARSSSLARTSCASCIQPAAPPSQTLQSGVRLGQRLCAKTRVSID
eukprot:8836226-Pyramimonas_sp.AAC.1